MQSDAIAYLLSSNSGPFQTIIYSGRYITFVYHLPEILGNRRHLRESIPPMKSPLTIGHVPILDNAS